MNHDNSPSTKASVELRFPIKRGDSTLDKLSFRRPTGRDLKRMMSRKGEWNQTLEIMLCTSNDQLTPEEVDNMDGADVVACQNAVAGFLE